MAKFRVYFLGLRGRIVEAVEIDAEGDREAIARGRELLAARSEMSGVEIWERARRVASLKPQ